MRVLSLALWLVVSWGVAAAEVVDVKSPRGPTTRLKIEPGADPWAVVVLFAGGKGALNISDDGVFGWGRGNFLVRARRHFRAHGVITAVIDAPTDRPRNLFWFRGTAEHAVDIGAVVNYLRTRYRKPVWLIGTSRGTNSVANAAVRLQSAGKPDGIVLTATMLGDNRKGDQVLAFDLSRITIPVLIAHHRDDACHVTPPEGVGTLKARLTSANPVKVLWYGGGSGIRGNPCQAFHYHGFRGIERKVIGDITRWIKSPTP